MSDIEKQIIDRLEELGKAGKAIALDTDSNEVSLIDGDEIGEDGFAVCVRKGTPTPFEDNEEGTCAGCGHAIVFRPSLPKAPQKICVECFKDMVENEGKKGN